MHTPYELHPPIEPYHSGYLAVSGPGDAAHELYFEESGNPDGQPALFLHGGPGGGTRPQVRQFFDPAVTRIVLLDQRGAGKSRPNVADDFDAALNGNNTQALIADLEALRAHLGVDVWALVVGGSWGSTLGIAYAQAHPERVRKLLLRGVFTFLRDEVDALFRSGASAAHYPDAWEAYAGFIEGHPRLRPEQRHDLLEGYRVLLADPTTRDAAARAFVGYELALSKLFRDEAAIAASLENPSRLIPFASLEVAYMLADGYLAPGQLLEPDNLARMRGIEISVVHGRNDHVCLPRAAWRLCRALDGVGVPVALHFVDGAGHSDSEPRIANALRREADRMVRA